MSLVSFKSIGKIHSSIERRVSEIIAMCSKMLLD
uniref:Uncharacterized protein n=1 Tax=Myoviridae sp. ctijX18 TaxID=2825154 RepID=A0A8S5UST6_9CAUD|nr:MAG TPA: hypothetical protein [Myoviridae sp. ctijX18]DAJ69050.1 MAG TPA: hypothetical protein [Caudoviricetes sp.]